MSEKTWNFIRIGMIIVLVLITASMYGYRPAISMILCSVIAFVMGYTFANETD